MTDDEIRQYHNERFAELPIEMINRACDVFNQRLGKQHQAEMDVAYEQLGPDEWFHQRYGHFEAGMTIRNMLRGAGLTDDQLPSKNWDDYYIQCLEYWIGRRGKLTLKGPDNMRQYATLEKQALKRPQWDNKYNLAFRNHLKNALDAAGVKYVNIHTTCDPNTNEAAPVRDYRWRLILQRGGRYGMSRWRPPLRMHLILLAVLRDLTPDLTRWQRARFWLHVQWNRLTGEYWHG